MSKPLKKIIDESSFDSNRTYYSENKLQNPNEKQIRNYLLEHPEFFIRNQELLLKIKFPKRNNYVKNQSINLLDKHREVLQARISTVENKYRNLVNIAKTNQELSNRIHRLLCNLAKCATLADFIACLTTQTNTRLQLTPKIWLWDVKLDPNSTATFSNLPIASQEIKALANTILPLQIFQHDCPKYICKLCNYTIALPISIKNNKSKKEVKGLLCFIEDQKDDFSESDNVDFLLVGRFAETCARLVEAHLFRL